MIAAASRRLYYFSSHGGGCLKVEDEGTGLHHWCDPPDSIHIVLVGADQCNMLILLVSCIMIACLVAMRCVVPYYSCRPLCESPQKSWRILCKTFLLLLFIVIPQTRFSPPLVHSVKGLLTCSSCGTRSSSDLTVTHSNCAGNKSYIFTFVFSQAPLRFLILCLGIRSAGVVSMICHHDETVLKVPVGCANI